MEEYGFFLSFNNAEKRDDLFRLPVNPETLEIKESGDSKSYTIIDLGEINAISYLKLTELTIESIFPAQPYPFVNVPKEGLWDPYRYVALIKKWMVSRKPIRFVFSALAEKGDKSGKARELSFRNPASFPFLPADGEAGYEFGINMAVSIESFSWKFSAGNSGDIEYSLSLKKYVFYQAVAVVKDKNGAAKAKPKRPDNKKKPTEYKMKKGDNLWDIAQKFLGNGQRYKEIQKLNNIPDNKLRKLREGTVLKLPESKAAKQP